MIAGLTFGIVQIRDNQRKRRQLAAIEATHAFVTAELRDAFRRILRLGPAAATEMLRADPALIRDAEVIVYASEVELIPFCGVLPAVGGGFPDPQDEADIPG